MILHDRRASGPSDFGDGFPTGALRRWRARSWLSRGVRAEVQLLTPPIWGLRVLVGLVVLAGAAVFLWVGSIVPLNQVGRETIDSIEGVEATINTLLLAVLGLFALVRLEARVKRQRVARGLHALRSVIHVIDMHQLTKDPVVLDPTYLPTGNSPERSLDPVGMSRYLDYCSELWRSPASWPPFTRRRSRMKAWPAR